MGEAVDLLTGNVRSCGHQIFILGVLCKLIGCSKGVERGADYRVIHRILNLLAEHPQVQIELTQALNILVFGHHSKRYLQKFGLQIDCKKKGRTEIVRPSAHVTGSTDL